VPPLQETLLVHFFPLFSDGLMDMGKRPSRLMSPLLKCPTPLPRSLPPLFPFSTRRFAIHPEPDALCFFFFCLVRQRNGPIPFLFPFPSSPPDAGCNDEDVFRILRGCIISKSRGFLPSFFFRSGRRLVKSFAPNFLFPSRRQ